MIGDAEFSIPVIFQDQKKIPVVDFAVFIDDAGLQGDHSSAAVSVGSPILHGFLMCELWMRFKGRLTVFLNLAVFASGECALILLSGGVIIPLERSHQPLNAMDGCSPFGLGRMTTEGF